MSFFRSPAWPSVSHSEIVRRARILVIDDGPFPYDRLFRRDGYTLEKWSSVKDLSRLERGEFDLILLDLHGVGTNESADHGFGILQHLREACPAQIIVAYSNAEWSLEYQPFFRQADAVLAKAADYVTFKRTVDELLDQRFSLGFYLARIEDLVSATDISPHAVRKKAERAILRNDLALLRTYLQRRVDDGALAERVLQVAQTALAAAALWTS
jgi:CheY-like chemotaxis protein